MLIMLAFHALLAHLLLAACSTYHRTSFYPFFMPFHPGPLLLFLYDLFPTSPLGPRITYSLTPFLLPISLYILILNFCFLHRLIFALWVALFATLSIGGHGLDSFPVIRLAGVRLTHARVASFISWLDPFWSGVFTPTPLCLHFFAGTGADWDLALLFIGVQICTFFLLALPVRHSVSRDPFKALAVRIPHLGCNDSSSAMAARRASFVIGSPSLHTRLLSARPHSTILRVLLPGLVYLGLAPRNPLARIL